MTMNGKLLHGVIVPMITPLKEKGTLDRPGLRKLLEHQITGGVNSLFLAGTTGEGPALTEDTRRELIAETCEFVGGKLPIVVAALSASQDDALATLRFAAEYGVAAAAIAPPYYMDLSDDDITRYGQQMAEESPVPVYLYNVPNANLPRFSTASLRHLSGLPNVRGLKDSSGDIAQLGQAIEIFKDRQDCSVLVGPEHLILHAYQIGAHGGVSGGANIFPEFYAAIYRAAQRSDWEAAAKLQGNINDVERFFYHVGDPPSSLIRGLKAAGVALSLCGPSMSRPYVEATHTELEAIRQTIKDFEAKFGPTLSE